MVGNEPRSRVWMSEHLVDVELEMTIDVVGDDVAEIVADEYGPDMPFQHLIDLTTAGPYGGRPLP